MTDSASVPAFETLRAFIARAESALNAALEYAEGHREAEVREHVESARLALNTLLDENERLQEALREIRAELVICVTDLSIEAARNGIAAIDNALEGGNGLHE